MKQGIALAKFRLLDGSGSVELKHTVEDVDRHGNVRIYVRPPGGKKVRLKERPGSEAFIAEHKAALAGNVAPTAPTSEKLPNSGRGTFSWLVLQYYACAEFRTLAPRTQRVRRGILEKIVEKHGPKKFADLEARHIRGWRDARVETPEAANAIVKALRQVFAFAVDTDLLKVNAAANVPYLESSGDGFHTWTIEEVQKFEDRHPIGSMARLALALMLYTGQRRSDAVRFGPGMVRAGWLFFTQAKNQKRKPIHLEIPIRDELRVIIEATPCGEQTFLTTQFGKPFTSNGFGNWFRKRCDEAKLPHCSAHGLRKAAATRLAELGASEKEIMAITGHTTSKEVTRYTKAASQKRLAERAFARKEASAKVPLLKRKKKSGTYSADKTLKLLMKRR